MSFTPDQIAALNAKLDVSHVAKRTQSGRELSYIEGWWAIAEANRIFGFHAWDRETVMLHTLSEPVQIDGKWRVYYAAKVRVTVHTEGGGRISREGCGYGSGIDRDVGSAHESALKEAETDAMKRALMTFGNPFGLALYDKTQANVGRAEKPDLGPSSEGEDFYGCSAPGMSAHAAKKEGLDAIHDQLRHTASELPNAEALRAFCKDNQPQIARMPRSWRVELRNAVEERAAELGLNNNERKAA